MILDDDKEQEPIIKKEWQSPALTIIECIDVEAGSIAFAHTDSAQNYS